jgi:hypothetical protein
VVFRFCPFQADSHFFAHQIRTSPSTPAINPGLQLHPAPPSLVTSRSQQGADALDLEEELLLKQEGVTFQGAVEEEEDIPEAGPSGTSGERAEGGLPAPKHERGHSMHEGYVELSTSR